MRFLFIFGSYLIFGSLCAQQANTNQQALEQLRLLQNRFENNPATPSNATPKTPVQTQAATPSAPAPAPVNVPPIINTPNVVTREDDAMIENLAYEQAEKQVFPMQEKEIIKMHKKYKKIELAKTTDPNVPPKPVAT